MPDAVIYMNMNVLESWRRLKRFSNAMVDAMTSVLDGLEEPSSFVEALNNLPNRAPSRSGVNWNQDDGSVDLSPEPAPKLAHCVYLCELLAIKKLEGLTFEGGLKYSLFVFCLAISNFEIHLEHRIIIQTIMGGLIKAHQHFRSPRAEHIKLFTSSGDRFAQLFQKYSMATNTISTDTLREELRALLISNRNNVALVVYQGFFAILARCNSSKVLLRAREAPQTWIRFMTADDDFIHFG